MKPLTSPLAIVSVAVVVATGVTAGLVVSSGSPRAHVLGEKIVGAGTSTISPASGTTLGGTSGAGSIGTSKPSGNNGNGNGNVKTFTISGSVSGLYPGGQVDLQLYITNPNQDINVTSLSATPTTIVLADGVSDTCTPGLTVGKWTGSKFPVSKNAVKQQAPGFIPISMSKDAGDACQGATFNFSYSGSGAQA